MFRIITIEREYGSGAAEIAKRLASRLGWKLWDRELTEEIARVARVDTAAVSKCEERVDGRFQRRVAIGQLDLTELESARQVFSGCFSGLKQEARSDGCNRSRLQSVCNKFSAAYCFHMYKVVNLDCIQFSRELLHGHLILADD